MRSPLTNLSKKVDNQCFLLELKLSRIQSNVAEFSRDDLWDSFLQNGVGNFLLFCSLRFINDFVMKNNFLEPYNHKKLNILKPIYFSKKSHTVLKILLSAQISWKNFFSKKCFFPGIGAFFTSRKTLIWVSLFCIKN